MNRIIVQVLLFEHDLVRKTVYTPDQVGGWLFRDHALAVSFGGERCFSLGMPLALNHGSDIL
jgi:hypothetical protein